MTPDNYTMIQKVSEAVSIGKEAAIALAESKWWEGKSNREIAEYQLSVREICCPFGVFHEAVEKSLGRPVFTHEFGLNYQGILNEFNGVEAAPSAEQVIDLLPKDKTIILAN